MYTWLNNWLSSHDLAQLTPWLTLVLLAVAAAVICVVLRFALRLALVRLVKSLTKVGHQKWAAIVLENKVPQRVANVVVPVVIAIAAAGIPEELNFLRKAASVAAGLVIALLFNSLCKVADAIYSRHDISKTRPITGVLQITQVVVYLLLCIVVLAHLMNQSVGVLLGGIGAATALLSLIFKDPILGFVAGVQLTTNDMLRIGDWITVPGAAADGTVTEISMTTVKVRNFDNSLTSIPAYTLVSNAFINWRAISDSGARRIKRAIYIDATSVRLLDDAMLAQLRGIDLLRGYLGESVEKAVEAPPGSEPLNHKTYTNIGAFRAYMQAYLDHNEHLRHDKGMSCLAHQLDPGAHGIPLEVYAFVATADWPTAEDVQANIFEHFFAAAPRFGLRLYQASSSSIVPSDLA